ncbi:tetratricopeptide repeat protein [Psychroflexus planctonicus]|nr:tetratricopeptide repeat protein [Psychroflexus planctonicus]
MKKIVFFFLIMLFSIHSWSQDNCSLGDEQYNNENYKTAIRSFQLCLKNNPKNQNAQYNLGKSYAKLENWEKASDVYERLVQNYPNNAEYNFLYGGSLGLYAKNLNPLKAVNYISDIKFYLKKAIELDANHIDARWALVQIYMELPFVVGGSKSTAEKYAEELLEISPIDGHLAFGFIEAYDENWSDAEKHYKKAVEVGQSETAFQKLIDVQLQQNKIEEVKTTLRKAYKITQKEQFKKKLEELRS